MRPSPSVQQSTPWKPKQYHLTLWEVEIREDFSEEILPLPLKRVVHQVKREEGIQKILRCENRHAFRKTVVYNESVGCQR